MFRFEKRAEKPIVFGFEHGRFLDAWSLLHLSTGLSMGVLAVMLGLGFTTGVTICVGLMFVYELVESALDVVEDVENAIFDVLVGLIGVLSIYGLNHYSPIDISLAGILLSALIVLDILILFYGWRSFLGKRFGLKDQALLPSPKTSVGRLQIRRDQISFFSFGIAVLPAALIIEYLSSAWALIWGVIVCLIAVLLRARK